MREPDDPAQEGEISAEEARISHERQQEKERRLSAETGVAQWQVRVELRTHHDTRALVQRLSAEGQSISKGWKFLVAGANCEDDAHRLAETIRMYTTADAKIRIEPWTPAFLGGFSTLPPSFQETGDEEEIIDAPASTEPAAGENAESRDPDGGETA